MLVSVIIPMYNREKTIKMAVESVLDQTYRNIELIIVDDCSTDKSVEIAKSIDDERIKVITSEKNGGACAARNIGIGFAKGDYIAFQDSDDFWHLDKLERSLYFLEKENADMVFSAVYRKGEEQYGDKGRIVPMYNLNLEENKLSRVLITNCVSTQTIVVKKEVVEKVRFDTRLPRFQDWDFALQVLEKGYSVYYIDEPLVDCQISADSITSDPGKAVKAIKILEKKYEKYLLEDVETGNGFYFRIACFYEKQGLNGAEYFWKAYKVKHSLLMLVRYILSKIRMYRLVCKALHKYTN